MPLSSEDRKKYIEAIDMILSKSDLETISERRVRRSVQEIVGYDLTPQKTEINRLIMERFDIFAARRDKLPLAATPVSSADEQNHGSILSAFIQPRGDSRLSEKQQLASDKFSGLPADTPPVEGKKENKVIDSDAVYAARLQAEENMRARPTRGMNIRRAAPIRRKVKTKTSKRVKPEGDPDLDSSLGAAKKEVIRSGGFHKPLNLSPALSALLGGELTLSRPQTVKRLWQYIRDRGLQDPNDRRQICCDDAMRAVFKQDRVHMFTMTKILSQNLYNPDE